MGVEDAPTGVAPTELGERVVAEDFTAWSEADEVEEWPQRRSWAPVLAVVAGSLFVVGVAGGIASRYLSVPDSTSAGVTTTVVEPQTVQKPPFNPHVPDGRTVVPPPPLSPDEQFLAALKKLGFTFRDTDNALTDAATVCTMLRDGADAMSISRQMAAESPLDVASAKVFVAQVTLNYPNCHTP